MAIDFSEQFPWNRIKRVTLNSTSTGTYANTTFDAVFIPKFYVKNAAIDKGAYRGKFAYYISDQEGEGFHLHPAFYWQGHPAKKGLYIVNNVSANASSSTCGVKVTPANVAAWFNKDMWGTEDSGWMAYNIYHHHMIARLMLLENGSMTVFSNSAQMYYAIREVAAANCCIYGVGSTSGSKLALYDNKGNESFVNTDAPSYYCPSHRGPGGTQVQPNIDLADIFLFQAMPWYSSFFGTFSNIISKSSGTCTATSETQGGSITFTGSYYGGIRLSSLLIYSTPSTKAQVQVTDWSNHGWFKKLAQGEIYTLSPTWRYGYYTHLGTNGFAYDVFTQYWNPGGASNGLSGSDERYGAALYAAITDYNKTPKSASEYNINISGLVGTPYEQYNKYYYKADSMYNLGLSTSNTTTINQPYTATKLVRVE